MRLFSKALEKGDRLEALQAGLVHGPSGTYFHQSCTCKMGTDEMSVVDGSLSVHGVEKLSIVDASAMPRVSTGNTMTPTVILAERFVDLMTS